MTVAWTALAHQETVTEGSGDEVAETGATPAKGPFAAVRSGDMLVVISIQPPEPGGFVRRTR